MILSDRSILLRARDMIRPFNRDLVQPSSVDVLLAPTLHNPDTRETTDISDGIPYLLTPGTFLLASTVETLTVPDDLVAVLDGKSSLGRRGVLVHATAGYCDPGFTGQVTLELFNASQRPFELIAGMRVGQLRFHVLSSPCLRPYGHPDLGSHYQDQTGPTPSAFDRKDQQ